MNYPSLKAVLQYLEANKRFKLVQRCPTLRNVDKATPLFINYLEFDTNQTKINLVVHNLGLVIKGSRNYGSTFEELVQFDINDFGEVDRTEIILSGDVHIQPAPGNDDDPDRFRYSRDWKNSTSFYVEYAIRNLGMSTICFEKLEYSKKVYEAMKYINNRFFGGRKCPIIVKKLTFPVTEGVLRLTEHLKLQTRKLYIGSNVDSIFNSIEPILNGNPRQVTIYAGSTVGLNYEHPVIKAAQKFIMENVSGDMSKILMNVTNPEVSVRNRMIDSNLCLNLIDKIIRDKTSIHRTYSFKGYEGFYDLFEAIKQRPGWICTEAECEELLPQVYSFAINES